MAGSCKLSNQNILPAPCCTKPAWAVYTAGPTRPWRTCCKTPADGTKPECMMLSSPPTPDEA